MRTIPTNIGLSTAAYDPIKFVPSVQEPLDTLPVISAVSANREFQAKQPCRNLGIVALLHLRPTLVAMVKGWIGLGATAQDRLIVAKVYKHSRERDFPE